ncbi:MAG: formyltransferase family protein, partial [Peptostreptococcaceae bacterium]|nr:formyltransferase family protein [Peptostreptococcaceae bacterium]
PKFVNELRNKMINIHPSLIPSFCGKGYYGQKVHQGVIDYGAKVTGATVHFVDEGADTGPIIMQETVVVKDDDDASSLAKRVLEIEHKILKKSISLFCENKLSIQGRRVFINE